MKQIYKSRWFSRILLSLLLITGVFQAQAFKEGVIYYNIISDTEVEVTNNGTATGGAYSGAIVIPETVSYNNTIYSVTSIGVSAFNNCTSLTSIEIPNSVTSIGNSAFNNCTGLTSIEIPNSVTSIGNYAFYGCTGLTSLTIGNSVTSIGERAFQTCSSLTSIDIPNSVTSIGNFVFFNCTNLEKINISDLKAWCNIEFDNWSQDYYWDLYLNGTKITDLTIPEGIEEIKPQAFRNCRSLTSVKIPNSLTSIGFSAFSGCTNLEKINISDLKAWCNINFSQGSNPLINGGHLYLNGKEITDLTIPEGIEEIKPYAFECCSSLTSVEIPNSVTSIGNSAFELCENLTSVEIPNSVTSIGNNAFYECTGLTSIDIPNSVTSIGDFAFQDCTGLTNVDIPNSVTSIGRYAFYRCTGVTSLTIGNSLTSIGEDAFSNCSSLTSVTSLNVTPPSCGYYNVFDNVPTSTCILYVPMQSVADYKAAWCWKNFTNIQGIEIVTGNIQAQDFDIQKKGTQNLNLNFSFSSSQNYSGFQFDVEMPEGLTISDLSLSDELKSAGFTSKNTSIEGNPIRVISYESQGKGVATTQGFITLTIKADANATEGEKIIKFTNVKLSTTVGSAMSLDDSSVTATVKGIPVSAINVAYSSGKEGDLYVEDSVVYSATATPEDASDKSVTWSIEDPSVASITTGEDNSKVTVKALKIGETTLKATANDGSGVIGTATIKVVATPISGVTISSKDNKTSIYPDETLVLTATVNPTNATAPITYVWTSGNTSVATVSGSTATVTLTGVKPGSTDITVSATNSAGSVTSQKFTVTVAPRPITSVALSEEGPLSLDLYKNKEKTITATVNPSNATDPVVTWKSDKPEIATVENGKITAVSLGSAVITATASNDAGSQSKSITVNVVATPAEELIITGDKHDLKVTEVLQLMAEVSPAETTYPEVEWSSSDNTKASVDASTGKVTAHAAGQVIITAKVKATPSVTDTYTLTITDFIKGDANDDGNVDVADVVTIALKSVEIEPDNWCLIAADFNNNGEADEQDVIETVNIILGSLPTRSIAELAPIMVSGDKLVVTCSKNESAFGKTMQVNLNNTYDYSAIKADVILPIGVSVESVSLGNKASDHGITYNVTDKNVLKFIIYSFENTPLIKGDDSLLTIKLNNVGGTDEITIENISATTSQSERYSLSSENNCTTGIDGIIGDSDGLYRVYSIQGVNVMNTTDAEDLNNLAKGPYIINGKKVMITK